MQAEPVTATPPRAFSPALLRQEWRDLVFLHWPLTPALAARLLPRATYPDLFGGVSYLGLVAFRMCRVGWLGLPPVPYLGSFPEVNIRLYSVGRDGRRGVVFRSLDAARLVPVAAGRAGFRLPYHWSRMSVERAGDIVTYTSRRRWPGPPGAQLRLRIRVGDRVAEPSALEHFLTARWGQHMAWHLGLSCYLPVAHPRWALYRASVLSLADDLIGAAGLPEPSEPPVSVLFSPGVPAHIGLPQRCGGDETPRAGATDPGPRRSATAAPARQQPPGRRPPWP